MSHSEKRSQRRGTLPNPIVPSTAARIVPHQHTEALFSTLRVFFSPHSAFSVQVPLKLVLQYWNQVAGMPAQRALFTLTVLCNEGMLSVVDLAS